MDSRRNGLRLLAFCLLGAGGSAHADDASLGAWQQYALRGITPDFDWADRPDAASVEPTVFEGALARTGLAPRVELTFGQAASPLSVSISRSLAGDTPLFEGGAVAPQRLTGVGVGLERTLVAPALTRSVSDSADLTVGAVFVQQAFASWGLGAGVRTYNSAVSTAPASFLGTSYGSGVRLGFDQSLGDALVLRTNYQSTIDMSALQNYRGLYARPGDFDLPAVASTDLAWRPGDASRVTFGVSRVMYSDIAPFTSAALPVRFLSLIGDASTPTFAWRDLTVFRMDWEWSPTADATLGFHYATRQQPEPTSRALRDALAGEFTDDNFGLSVTRRFDGFGSLRFAASYAPAQYFLGNASFGNRDARGEQVEVEAVWAMAF
ncbi:MAG: hypothetical protein LW860_13360 [Xanthomonadaceae bacterium]|jgi:long-chain fatty acid transport protein|nr:hypothetical protein [Xanthomonadaceae bacterium]